MTDARLVATNPETSELVPVAVNAQGQLKTEVGTIELIDNNLTVNGDLTVSGQINGGSGGSGGLPEPLGTEGQIVQIVNGVPAWADPPAVGPQVDPNIVLLNGDNSTPSLFELKDDQGVIANGVEDWNAYSYGLTNWREVPYTYYLMGVSKTNQLQAEVYFNLSNCLGKVINVAVYAMAQTNIKGETWYYRGAFDSDYIQPIRDAVSYKPGSSGKHYSSGYVSFLCNRDSYENVKFTLTFEPDDRFEPGLLYWMALNRWWIETTDEYLVGRNAERREKIKDLRNTVDTTDLLGEAGSTTDIDDLRSS